MQELELTITEAGSASPLIRSLRLAAADGATLPAFTPGAHVRVVIPGLAEPRSYSHTIFRFNERLFVKGAVRRSRVACRCLNDRRTYNIDRLAGVEVGSPVPLVMQEP